MVKISFLRPIDQFQGTRRFLDELKFCLQNNSLECLVLSVAFAKIGPLIRLLPLLEEWRKKGKRIEGIFGVDLKGTSKQALEFALEFFDAAYVIHSTSHATFHPKFYLFYENRSAICFYGSQNLTVGGTETNFEGGVKVEIKRPESEDAFQDALSCWTSLLPDVCEMTRLLDADLLKQLLDSGLIFDEVESKPQRLKPVEISADGSTPASVSQSSLFPRSYPKPPSPIPKSAFTNKTKKALTISAPRKALQEFQQATETVPSEALIMEIVPHHNGEVFLSKQAIDQNPKFFGFPFTGNTTPKRSENASYPQREPDPIVNIIVYDSSGTLALTKTGFALNTVFYERKSEIRITFSQDLLSVVAARSVMVMRQTGEPHDYDIEIFNPGSERHQEYLNACNQTLPSGGSPNPRRMGWL